MMNLQEKLKQLRLEKGMTLEEVGNKVGVGKSTVRKWESGDIKNMRRDKIGLLADALGVSPAYLMGWSDEKDAHDLLNRMSVQHLSRLLVVGSVRCGPNGLAYEEVEGAELADVPNPEEYFYLRATGDSMEPRIFEGDYVLVHIQEDVESGELAVVTIDGEELTGRSATCWHLIKAIPRAGRFGPGFSWGQWPSYSMRPDR